MGLSRIEAAEDCVRRIESLGVRCAPDSRYGRMVSALRKGKIEPEDSDFAVALEAIRDVRVTQYALAALMDAVAGDSLADKAKLLVKDDPLPQDSPLNSPGRDIQCELYVASVCAKAGMRPRLVEPDIVCDVNDKTFCIAVKRIKNESKFEARFRDGARQIAETGIPGFIAIDVSIAFNPANLPLVGDVDIYTMQIAHRQARRLSVDQHHERMKEWLRGREIRGLLIVDHVLRYDQSDNDWYLESMTYAVPFTQHNQRRSREFDAFYRTYQRGMFNLKSS